MTTHYRQIHWLLIACVLAICMIATAQPLYADNPITGTNTIPTGQIIPSKPEAKHQLVIVRHYTKPEKIHTNERFKIHLEVKNLGNIPAVGHYVKRTNCHTSDLPFNFENSCIQQLPTLDANQSERVTFVLHSKSTITTQTSAAINFFITANPEENSGTSAENQTLVTVNIEIFPRMPKLIIQNHHTSPSPVHVQQPFDLHLEIKNVGTGTARKIEIRGPSGCMSGGLIIESSCNQGIADIEPDHSRHVTFRIRYVGTTEGITDHGMGVSVSFTLTYEQADTADQSVNIGIAIFPKPNPAENLIIEHYRTVPAQVRAQAPFVLHLVIKNNGHSRSGKAAIQGGKGDGTCQLDNDFFIMDQCSKQIPEMSPGQSQKITFQLRYTKKQDQVVPEAKEIQFKLGEQTQTVGIQIYANLTIQDTDPITLERPFEPDVLITTIRRAQVTTCGPLTDDAPDTPCTLVLATTLQQTGPVRNVVVDFCLASNEFFTPQNPCHHPVQGNQSSVAQSFDFAGTKSDIGTVSDDTKLTVNINYEFQHDHQWIRRKKTQELHASLAWFSDNASPAASAAAMAPESAPMGGPFAVVQTKSLNIRAGPGLDYAVVGGTIQGRRHRITGRNAATSWWRIDVNGHHGWVFAGLVRAMEAERVPVIGGPPTQAPPNRAPSPPDGQMGPAEGGRPSRPQAPNADPGTPPGQAGPPAAPQRPGPSNNPAAQEAAGPSQAATKPLLFIDSFRSTPVQPAVGEPFELEIIIHNAGNTPVEQLTVEWPNDKLVPLGTGAKQWLNTLPAGQRLVLTGQFVLTDASATVPIQLPVVLRYRLPNGQPAQQEDQINLVWKKVAQGTGGPLSSPQTSARPMWLRVVFGLVGLGANPQ